MLKTVKNESGIRVDPPPHFFPVFLLEDAPKQRGCCIKPLIVSTFLQMPNPTAKYIGDFI